MICPPRADPGSVLGSWIGSRGTRHAVAEASSRRNHQPAEPNRRTGVSEQNPYHRRAEYGGLRVDQAPRLKQSETGNVRLKRAVVGFTLGNQLLNGAAEGNL